MEAEFHNTQYTWYTAFPKVRTWTKARYSKQKLRSKTQNNFRYLKDKPINQHIFERQAKKTVISFHLIIRPKPGLQQRRQQTWVSSKECS